MRHTRSRLLPALTLLVIAATGCAEGDDAPARDAGFDTAAADRGPVAEDPGLPTDSTLFSPSPGGEAGIEGTLWVSGTEPGQAEGISLVAQLRGVPARAYGWAIHRGGCDAPDDILLPLGWGTEAGTEGDRQRSGAGGPLGEMRPAFEPSLEGEVAETVWVPLRDGLDRATLEAAPHSLRIHPEPGDERVEPSVACAPLPPLPR